MQKHSKGIVKYTFISEVATSKVSSMGRESISVGDKLSIPMSCMIV